MGRPEITSRNTGNKQVRLLPWGLTNWRVTMNRDLDPAVVLLACIVGMAITAGLCALLHWTGIW